MRNIISLEPFLPSLRDFDRLMSEGIATGDFVPAVDIFQDKDNLIVEMAAPRIDPDKIEISVEHDVLTISGHTESKQEVKREDYYRKEVREGSFSRSLILPMPVKGDKAEATYEKGTLRVVLPKREEVKPKRIAVKVSAPAKKLAVKK
jgi:HSP20 family protein